MRGIYDQLVKELAIAFPSDFLTLMMPEIARRTDLSKVVFESNPELFLDTPRGRGRVL
jgi:hypothetical protein